MYGYKTFRELEKELPKNDERNGGETQADDFVNRSLLRRLRRAETRLSNIWGNDHVNNNSGIFKNNIQDIFYVPYTNTLY